MVWIINGLVYGFFTALYTIVNQHYKLNGYLLGIWRGFGISFLFMPSLFFFKVPTDAYYWFLLIFQGWLIGFYDSHLFFASAKYGAGPTSRILTLTALVTTFLWWAITPSAFMKLFDNGTIFITLLLVLYGFTVSYWYMLKNKISRALTFYMTPAIFAFAFMSIITKDIAMRGSEVWFAISYYLVVATFVSGCYNAYYYALTEKPGFIGFFKNIFAPKVLRAGIYIVSFSAALITAKTVALRIAPNPGYVVALVLTAPFFVFFLNKYSKVTDKLSLKAGFSMVFFLILMLILVTGNFGIYD